MPIQKTDDVIKLKKHSALILGMPGKGKTTLGLSAPKPLLVDADNGLGRVDSQYRPQNFMPLKTYSEFLKDLTPEILAPYESILIDTLGRLIEKIIDYVGELNPKNLRTTGAPSMMGWGAVGETFRQLTKKILSLNKNVIYIAHISEEEDDGKKVYRIDAAGKAKKEIYKDLDFAGFLEVYAGDLIINWAPSERHYSKNILGIKDPEKVPDLSNGGMNNYMTKLFERATTKATTDAVIRDKYNVIKDEIVALVDGIKTVDDANIALTEFGKMDKIYCSDEEAKILLKGKVDSLGYKYNHQSKNFEIPAKLDNKDAQPATK